jgi:hypothetical protein
MILRRSRGHQGVYPDLTVEFILYFPAKLARRVLQQRSTMPRKHSIKAIVRTQYGSADVLQFAELATPTPADHEVMIKLCAASVNPLDLFLMKGAPWNRVIPGLRTPKHKARLAVWVHLRCRLPKRSGLKSLPS